MLGIIAVRGFHLLDCRPLLKILSGWFATPLIAGLLAYAGAWIVL